MSDETEITNPAAVLGQQPAAPAPKVAVAEPTPKPVVEEPLFLGERIKRAQRQALKEAGIDVKKNEDPVKAAADFKKEQQEKKTKRRELSQQLDEKSLKLGELEPAIKIHAESAMAKLTEEQRARIKTVAGDNPSKQLEAIAILDTVTPPATSAADPAAAKAAKTVEAAANTAAPAAPAANLFTSEAPVRERWQQIKAIQDPTARGAMSALFLLQHGDELLKPQ